MTISPAGLRRWRNLDGAAKAVGVEERERRLEGDDPHARRDFAFAAPSPATRSTSPGCVSNSIACARVVVQTPCSSDSMTPTPTPCFDRQRQHGESRSRGSGANSAPAPPPHVDHRANPQDALARRTASTPASAACGTCAMRPPANSGHAQARARRRRARQAAKRRRSPRRWRCAAGWRRPERRRVNPAMQVGGANADEVAIDVRACARVGTKARVVAAVCTITMRATMAASGASCGKSSSETIGKESCGAVPLDRPPASRRRAPRARAPTIMRPLSARPNSAAGKPLADPSARRP